MSEVSTTPSDDPLDVPVRFVPGVGPQNAELLERLRVITAGDLLLYLPRQILDLTDLRAVNELEEGRLQSVVGTVVDREARTLTRGRSLTAVLIDNPGGYLRGTWFNQPWMLRRFVEGQRVVFSEKPKWRGGRWEMSHPRVQWLEDEEGAEDGGGVIPKYGLTEGLTLWQLRRMIASTIDFCLESLVDRFPPTLRETHELPELKIAVRDVHFPRSVEHYEAARRRMQWEELLPFELGIALRRRARRTGLQAPVLPTTAKVDARIRRLFPFRFTAGQDQAIEQVRRDLASNQPMHRLLQGDVGAGKTVVAIYAMLVAIANGHQAALMVPTEVLAQQHWNTVEQTLAESRVRRLLLTGQLTAAQRRDALAGIRNGDFDLIVGTQALIQKDLEFAKLGVVVIDEQHKFGVMQRSRFSDHSTSPHVLVMTATPIPRSLCLTQYGDLDLSIVRDQPAGRQSVSTSRILSPSARDKMWDFVRRKLREGRQAYVVCPQVDGDIDGIPGAIQVHQYLRDGELKDFTVGLVHGQMSTDDKQTAMRAFRDCETHVLVATTVIEVGIDVANATLMIILGADRFGLSQLHQLRGRICRGIHRGYCFLCATTDSDDANERLQALEACADGFTIAEKDFELRGPGDVLGTRQHGTHALSAATAMNLELIEDVRDAAFEIVDSTRIDDSAHAALQAVVIERYGESMQLPISG